MFRWWKAAATGWAVLMLAGCASYPMGNYKGADVGYLVVSVGEAPGTDLFREELRVREKGKPQSERPYAANFDGGHVDYKGETGVGTVSVLSYQPGDYEFHQIVSVMEGHGSQPIFNLAGRFSPPLKVLRLSEIVPAAVYPKVDTQYFTSKDFSIPFTIKPGEVTYVGNYQAAALATYKNMLGNIRSMGGVYFVVRDERERDMKIARSKAIQEGLKFNGVNYMVPDPAAIGSDYFRSKLVDE